MGIFLLLVTVATAAALVWSISVVNGTTSASLSDGSAMSSNSAIDATTVACIAMMVASCDG